VTDRRAAEVGKRVLAGLEKAHQRAAERVQARVRALAEEVLTLAAMDIESGKPSWGRAARIRRKMGYTLSERQKKRYLDRLSEKSKLVAQNDSIHLQEAHHV
jgi:hypothetical protein